MTISFLQIPEPYILMKNSIQNKEIKRIYSNINFNYYPIDICSERLSDSNDNTNRKIIKYKHLLTFLTKYKFFTYHISKIRKDFQNNGKGNNFNDLKIPANTFSQFIDVVICAEGQCLIIEQIENEIFKKILSKCKAKKISMINSNINMESENEEEANVKEEITSFCEYYKKEINLNKFVKNTITSISSYLIRRYFYPNEYFNDYSFFIFNPTNKSYVPNDKINDISLLINENFDEETSHQIMKIMNDDITANAIVNQNKQNFHQSDFIILRQIFSTGKARFYIVLHIESLHIFMMKMILSSYENTMEYKREINFCSKYSHRCINRFYGFLLEDEKIMGFIYEFMSNGSLFSFILNHKNELNDFYSILVINRIIQGIDYIHFNSLIHRDLKPQNILIDHNFLPFISDFETIRHIENDEDEMTSDIGSQLYSSPEQQNNGEAYSYSSDIYSFGLIIYFVFEKKHMWPLNDPLINSYKMKNMIKPMTKGSENIHKLYEMCVKYSASERPTIQQIESFIFSEILEINSNSNDFSFIDEIKPSLLIQLFYESLFISPFLNEILSENGFDFYQCLNQVASLDPAYIFQIGFDYFLGENVQKDLLYAKKMFKIAAKKNNPDAIFYLGYMYNNGIGVKQNITKAKKYFEILAKNGNEDACFELADIWFDEKDYLKAISYFQKAQNKYPNACISLANIYSTGTGVARDYSRARYYYEIAAGKNYSVAQVKLGYIYFFGKGTEVNYEKARYYFELASQHNQSDALCFLGTIYERGYGVKQNYEKARKYYELSAFMQNSDAFVMLGHFYLYGIGVKKNIKKAVCYYESAAEMNNATALFALGNILSFNCCASICVYCPNDLLDIPEAIRCYTKCTEIYVEELVYHNNEGMDSSDSRINRYRYPSYNALGLIYMFVYHDIEKASQCIKESAFGEFPYGQNNYGLINQFYLNNLANAEYMYKRAAEHNFAFAEYNLAYLKEKEGKIDESFEYYLKVTKHSQKNLIYKEVDFYNYSLDILLEYITCIANIKISEYYFKKSNFIKFKDHFFPFFSNVSVGDIINIRKLPLLSTLKNLTLNSNGQTNSIAFVSKQIQFLDYIISNKVFHINFLNEINVVCSNIEEFIHNPPYGLLFGAANNLEIKNKNDKIKNSKSKNIDKSFYEGFGYDI